MAERALLTATQKLIPLCYISCQQFDWPSSALNPSSPSLCELLVRTSIAESCARDLARGRCNL
eukprot:2583321-Rhodomonas_salina.3